MSRSFQQRHVPLSPYKVAADLYSELFKTPKVEEMTKQLGNIRPLGINPDPCQSLETSFGASMVYLSNKCQDDPVLKAGCAQLHTDIRELPDLGPGVWHLWLVQLVCCP